MVSLTASGEIFSLRAPFDAQSQEGWLTADGEAVIGADVMAELSLCHGISAAVGAEIALGVNANLGALHLLGIGGDGLDHGWVFHCTCRWVGGEGGGAEQPDAQAGDQ